LTNYLIDPVNRQEIEEHAARIEGVFEVLRRLPPELASLLAPAAPAAAVNLDEPAAVPHVQETTQNSGAEDLSGPMAGVQEDLRQVFGRNFFIDVSDRAQRVRPLNPRDGRYWGAFVRRAKLGPENLQRLHITAWHDEQPNILIDGILFPCDAEEAGLARDRQGRWMIVLNQISQQPMRLNAYHEFAHLLIHKTYPASTPPFDSADMNEYLVDYVAWKILKQINRAEAASYEREMLPVHQRRIKLGQLTDVHQIGNSLLKKIRHQDDSGDLLPAAPAAADNFPPLVNEWLTRVREFLKGDSDKNILGILVFGSTARGAAEPRDLDYFLIKKTKHCFTLEDPEDDVFDKRLMEQCPYARLSARTLAIQGPHRESPDALRELVVSHLFLPPVVLEDPGLEKHGQSPFITHWFVLARTREEEKHLTEWILDKIRSVQNPAGSYSEDSPRLGLRIDKGLLDDEFEQTFEAKGATVEDALAHFTLQWPGIGRLLERARLAGELAVYLLRGELETRVVDEKTLLRAGDALALRRHPTAPAATLLALSSEASPRIGIVLSPDQIARYSHEVPFWNWESAVKLPWSELIRDPSKPHLPHADSANEMTYNANQHVVRSEFLEFMRRMAIGQTIDLQEFKMFLSKLNTLVLTATGLYLPPTLTMRSYYPAGASPEIIEKWIRDGVAGHYVNPDEPTDRRLGLILEQLIHFVERSRQGALPPELIEIVASFYKSTMGVAEGGFVNLFLFEQANNSLFMNLANAMLRLSGLQGISHGDLDERSSHFNGDYWFFDNLGFVREFCQMVDLANSHENESAIAERAA
jgi:hypothetical protein